MVTIFGLGSNMGDRRAYLAAAVAALSALGAHPRASQIHESQALLPADAPPEWNIPYLNMALSIDTTLTPDALLAHTQALEISLGRIRRGHWGPREIDIDILAMGNTVLATPTLTLPHARLLERDFALVPLAEIAPLWRHPVDGRTAQALVSAFGFSL